MKRSIKWVLLCSIQLYVAFIESDYYFFKLFWLSYMVTHLPIQIKSHDCLEGPLLIWWLNHIWPPYVINISHWVSDDIFCIEQIKEQMAYLADTSYVVSERPLVVAVQNYNLWSLLGCHGGELDQSWWLQSLKHTHLMPLLNLLSLSILFPEFWWLSLLLCVYI